MMEIIFEFEIEYEICLQMPDQGKALVYTSAYSALSDFRFYEILVHQPDDQGTYSMTFF